MSPAGVFQGGHTAAPRHKAANWRYGRHDGGRLVVPHLGCGRDERKPEWPGWHSGAHALLASKGYVRKYPHLSQWDDWYVLESR